jgi:nucleoid-associated protein YgaU
VLHPGSLAAWAAERNAADIGFAIIRLLALTFAWYLVAATLLQVAAARTRRRSLTQVADLLTLSFARTLVAGLAGVGLSSAALGATVLTGTAAPPPATALRPGAPARHFATQWVDDAKPSDPGTATLAVDDPPPPPTPAPAPAPPNPDHHWTVEQGDHFWSIATAVLQHAWGRPASAEEVASYWQKLIAANRAELADPLNPDLLFAGQVLALPDIPPAWPG